MTDNPDHGLVLFDLLTKADDGDAAPLESYLAEAPGRAATSNLAYVLLTRHQYGTLREGRWHAYSSQPHSNPWPGTPTRLALALLRCEAGSARSWFELTLPLGMRIEGISTEGGRFRICTGGDTVTTSGDAIFRTIAGNQPCAGAQARLRHNGRPAPAVGRRSP